MGARLALLAVWLQLFLSLGHIHPSDIFLYGHPVAQGPGAAQMLPDRSTTPVPLSPLSDNAATDLDCSICASMVLAGSVVLPGAVDLPLPPMASPHALSGLVSFAFAPAEFLLFQTRAPPLV